jgi:hypothetical protein
MTRGGPRYHPPTLESLKDISDIQILKAVRILAGTHPAPDRTDLVMMGYSQSFVNDMTDRQVRKVDLKPIAVGILHKSISALVSEHRPKEQNEDNPGDHSARQATV